MLWWKPTCLLAILLNLSTIYSAASDDESSTSKPEPPMSGQFKKATMDKLWKCMRDNKDKHSSLKAIFHGRKGKVVNENGDEIDCSSYMLYEGHYEPCINLMLCFVGEVVYDEDGPYGTDTDETAADDEPVVDVDITLVDIKTEQDIAPDTAKGINVSRITEADKALLEGQMYNLLRLQHCVLGEAALFLTNETDPAFPAQKTLDYFYLLEWAKRNHNRLPDDREKFFVRTWISKMVLVNMQVFIERIKILKKVMAEDDEKVIDRIIAKLPKLVPIELLLGLTEASMLPSLKDIAGTDYENQKEVYEKYVQISDIALKMVTTPPTLPENFHCKT